MRSIWVIASHHRRRIEILNDTSRVYESLNKNMSNATRNSLDRAKNPSMRNYYVLRMIQIRDALPHKTTPTLTLCIVKFGAHCIIWEDVNKYSLLKARFLRFFSFKTRVSKHNFCK